MLKDNMPVDPFSEGGGDYTQFAANCYAMYSALVASGFSEEQAFRFTVGLTTSMIVATQRAKQDGVLE